MPNTEAGGNTFKEVLGRGFERAGLLTVSDDPHCIGPRSWWHGPLDVENLAIGAVSLVADAITALDTQLFGGAYGRVSSLSNHVAAAFGPTAHLRVAGRSVPGFAQHSGFFQTADGWIRTHANYPHHERELLRAVGANESTTLQEALSRLTSNQAQDLIIDAGAVGAAVQSRAQWLGSEIGKAAQVGDWAQFADHGAAEGGRWTGDRQGAGPLAGLRVLDLTRVIAGPTATRTLAAFGAQVLRVDAPQLPEVTGQHIDTGFGKRSTLVDISTPAGSKRMHELLSSADVLVSGYRSGSLENLGFGAQELQDKYPQLIIAELNAWGHHGPWRTVRGFDSIVQAACGIADVYRTADGTPGALPVQALDHATGYGLAAAIISMVHARAEGRMVSSVRSSLARTAQALFELGSPTTPRQDLDTPELGHKDSVYGMLDYAKTPFTVSSQPLDFPAAPTAYGQDQPVWL